MGQKMVKEEDQKKKKQLQGEHQTNLAEGESEAVEESLRHHENDPRFRKQEK